MRIIHIIDSFNTGGAERVTIDLANLFSEHHHQVAICLITEKGDLHQELSKEVELVRLKRNFKYNPFKLVKLFFILKKYDIIHVHLHYNLVYTFCSGIFLIKKKIFYHEHNGDINLRKSYLRIRKFLMRKLIFISVSRKMAEWAFEKMGMNKSSVYFLPNIIRKKNIIQSTTPYGVLMVSNINRTKNIEFALNLLNDWDEMENLTIVGRVQDNDYYEELKDYIKVNHLENRVVFKHNITDIQNEIVKYKLAIHTSKSESGPLVLVEYLAHQIPFLSYNTGEVVQLISTKLPSFILNDFNTESWISTAKNLDKKDYKIGMQEVFNLYFNEENYYKGCLKIYEENLA